MELGAAASSKTSICDVGPFLVAARPILRTSFFDHFSIPPLPKWVRTHVGPGPKWARAQGGPGAQVGPGPKWPRAQVRPGPKWVQGPNGSRAQAGPGPKLRAQVGPGTKWDPPFFSGGAIRKGRRPEGGTRVMAPEGLSHIYKAPQKYSTARHQSIGVRGKARIS